MILTKPESEQRCRREFVAVQSVYRAWKRKPYGMVNRREAVDGGRGYWWAQRYCWPTSSQIHRNTQPSAFIQQTSLLFLFVPLLSFVWGYHISVSWNRDIIAIHNRKIVTTLNQKLFRHVKPVYKFRPAQCTICLLYTSRCV